MAVSEERVRAYLTDVAAAPAGTYPENRDTLAAIGDVVESPNVTEDARFIAAIRDGGEPALARELAAERAARYSDEARAAVADIVEAALAGTGGGVYDDDGRARASRERRDQVALSEAHPAQEILALVAGGRPVPGVDRLISFGLERATAATVDRAARIVAAYANGGPRNPRFLARQLAEEIAEQHPLPEPDPWADFSVGDSE